MAIRRVTSFVVGAVLGSGAALAQTPLLLFTDPHNLSNTPLYSQSANVAADAGSGVYVVWEESFSRLLFARSTDGGSTFGPPKDLVPAEPALWPAQIDLAATGAGTVHVAYTAFDGVFGGAEIVYLRSQDGGDTLEPPIVLSEIDSFNSTSASIAAGWGIAVAWSDDDLGTGATRIAYSQSVDGGATFSAARTLVEGGAPVGCPSVAMSGASSVFLSWMRGNVPTMDVYFSRSSDGGTTFSSPLNVSNSPETASWCASLAVDSSGALYALWMEGTFTIEMKLLLARSTDGGLTWSAPQILVPDDPELIDTTLAVAGSGTVYAAWMTGRDATGYRCFLVVSTDGARNFGAPIPVPGCGAMVAPSPARLHIVWHPLGAQFVPDIFHVRGELRVDRPLDYYTLAPCRVVDTRLGDAPSLLANTTRSFPAAGRCGIPADATAVAVNATTTLQTDIGNLRLFAAGSAMPPASTVNFSANRTRGNNAIVSLGLDGRIAARSVMPTAPGAKVDLVLDVYGYFK